MNAAPSSRADPLGLGHQGPTDAALARPGIDDEREDAHDPVVVLEARHGVEGDEAEQRAVVLGHDDPGIGRGEAPQPDDDVARAGRVALVGEQRRRSPRRRWPRRGGAAIVAWSVMRGWYPPRRRPGAGAGRGSGRPERCRSGPNGPGAVERPSRRHGARPAVDADPARTRPPAALRHVGPGARAEPALGRRFEDHQRDAAGQRVEGAPGSGRRAPPNRAPR